MFVYADHGKETCSTEKVTNLGRKTEPVAYCSLQGTLIMGSTFIINWTLIRRHDQKCYSFLHIVIVWSSDGVCGKIYGEAQLCVNLI